MTDLTEQWQKGELPRGWYYIKDVDGDIYVAQNEIYYDYQNDKSFTTFWNAQEDVAEVLAKVPTYSEYLALQSDSLAKNEGAEIVAELEAKVKKLKKDYKDLEYKFRSYKDFKETVYDLDTSRLEEENTKLKELLKECRECVDENLEFSQSIGRNRIQPRNKGLLKRIDEVLK